MRCLQYTIAGIPSISSCRCLWVQTYHCGSSLAPAAFATHHRTYSISSRPLNHCRHIHLEHMLSNAKQTDSRELYQLWQLFGISCFSPAFPYLSIDNGAPCCKLTSNMNEYMDQIECPLAGFTTDLRLGVGVLWFFCWSVRVSNELGGIFDVYFAGGDYSGLLELCSLP